MAWESHLPLDCVPSGLQFILPGKHDHLRGKETCLNEQRKTKLLPGGFYLWSKSTTRNNQQQSTLIGHIKRWWKDKISRKYKDGSNQWRSSPSSSAAFPPLKMHPCSHFPQISTTIYLQICHTLIWLKSEISWAFSVYNWGFKSICICICIFFLFECVLNLPENLSQLSWKLKVVSLTEVSWDQPFPILDWIYLIIFDWTFDCLDLTLFR